MSENTTVIYHNPDCGTSRNTSRGTRLCRPAKVVLEVLPQPQKGFFAKEDGEVVVNEGGQRVG